MIATTERRPADRPATVSESARSVSRGLADRVGEDGSVLATDLEPRLLADIERPNLEVRALIVAA